jgi:hypothetical protein
MISALVVLRGQPSPDRPDREHSQDDSVTSAGERWLCCRSCGAKIAALSAVLPSDTPLVFANPSGLVFELVLLREARGLALIGQATQEFTWFQSYAWRVALCHGCGTHLGWRFDAVGPETPLSGFFGLLRRELVENRIPD